MDDSERNRKIVVTGYALTGATLGYCGYRATNAGEVMVVGTALGLAIGLINQYRTETSKIITTDDHEIMVTQGSGSESFTKSVFGWMVASRVTIPIVVLTGGAVLAALCT